MVNKEHKKIYSALKKFNDLGKKLTYNSEYVLTQGMMIGFQNEFDKNDDNSHVAVGVSYAFMTNQKYIDGLDALYYLALQINGTELYRMDKTGTFLRFEIDDPYTCDYPKLYLVYEVEVEERSAKEEFIKRVVENPKIKYTDPDEVRSLISDGPDLDIELFSALVSFEKKFKPNLVTRETRFEIDILKEETDVLKKARYTVLEMQDFEDFYDGLTHKYDIDNMEMVEILNSTSPMKISIDPYPDETCGPFNILVMKSVFKGASNKSTGTIRVIQGDEEYSYILVEVKDTNATTCTVYKAVNY